MSRGLLRSGLGRIVGNVQGFALTSVSFLLGSPDKWALKAPKWLRLLAFASGGLENDSRPGCKFLMTLSWPQCYTCRCELYTIQRFAMTCHVTWRMARYAMKGLRC